MPWSVVSLKNACSFSTLELAWVSNRFLVSIVSMCFNCVCAANFILWSKWHCDLCANRLDSRCVNLTVTKINRMSSVSAHTRCTLVRLAPGTARVLTVTWCSDRAVANSRKTIYTCTVADDCSFCLRVCQQQCFWNRILCFYCPTQSRVSIRAWERWHLSTPWQLASSTSQIKRLKVYLLC